MYILNIVFINVTSLFGAYIVKYVVLTAYLEAHKGITRSRGWKRLSTSFRQKFSPSPSPQPHPLFQSNKGVAKQHPPEVTLHKFNVQPRDVHQVSSAALVPYDL